MTRNAGNEEYDLTQLVHRVWQRI